MLLMINLRIIPKKPALILEGTKRILIITDLHIGFEDKFERNDVFVGKNTTILNTISEVDEIINSENPDMLVLLGDIKSSIKSISKNEWEEIPLFLKKMNEKIETILVPGNHDANISNLVPKETTITSSIGLVIENTLLTHGHTLPSTNYSHVDKIIMGHIHPVFFQKESLINGQRVWITMKIEKQNIFSSDNGEIEITIVPSFNQYFYATNKKYYKKSISPIIQKIKKCKSAKILTLDGTIIGNEDLLECVL